MSGKDDFIELNEKFSSLNSKKILTSIDNNLTTIITASKNLQSDTDKNLIASDLATIKTVSIESVLEKCNMIKASVDRYMIAEEDTLVPRKIRYYKRTKNASQPKVIKHMREKISKNNIPIQAGDIFPLIDFDGDGDSDD